MEPEKPQETLEDEVFGWAADVFASQPDTSSTTNLSEFEVEYSIDKDPVTGEESFAYFGVWRNNDGY